MHRTQTAPREECDRPAWLCPFAILAGLRGMRCRTTAADCLLFQQMLLSRGRTPADASGAGAALLSERSAAAMASDLLDGSLGSAAFNTHVADVPGTAGAACACWGVHAPGQGVACALEQRGHVLACSRAQCSRYGAIVRG